jgi:nitrous oxidase accessory protein NosD
VTDESGNIGTPVINRNNIEGNGVGLRNESTQEVDAQYNWWNDPGGPGADLDEDGIFGDTVEGSVNYSNWLPERL